MNPQVSPRVLLDTPNGSIPLKYTIERMPDQPDAQVAKTIMRMCEYVNQDCQAYPVKQDLEAALALDPGNPLGSIHHFVRSRMEFENDDKGTEPYTWMLERPGMGPEDDYFVEMLKRPVDVSFEFAATGQKVKGDCDDFSMMCAALLRAAGIDCCFATVGANEKEPNVYSHVYVVAYCRGQRIPMDCSHGPYASWETPNRFGKYYEWQVYDRAAWGSLGVAFSLAAWWAWKNREEVRGWFR